MPRRQTSLQILLSALFPVLLFAQSTPQVIKLQGSLSRSGVGPVTGTVTMTMTMHDAPAGGTTLAIVGPTPVAVNDGIYAVDLPFPAAAFGGAQRYIEITVDGEILAPRIQLGSSAFAYVAETVDGYHANELEESAEIDERAAAHEAAPDPHPTYVLRSGDSMTGDLQVVGIIESLVGGYRFPDGTTQSTAAGGEGGAPLFNNVRTGMNTSAAMVVGPGASLSASGGGTITATAAPGYVPLAGGTMTGAGTTHNVGDVIVLPTPATAGSQAPAIVFKGPAGDGTVDPAHWRQFVQYGGSSNHDKVLSTCYNCTWNETGSWQRDVSGVRAWNFDLESRFTTGDPSAVGGAIEINVNVDHDTTGPFIADHRPFFFTWNYDEVEVFQTIGVSDNNGAFFQMGGDGQFILKAGKDDAGVLLPIVLGSSLASPVVVGNDVFTPAHLFVDGQSDQIQLRVQGAATQTTPIALFESDGAVARVAIYNDGKLLISYINMQESDTDPYCDVAEFNLFADDSEDKIKVCENGVKTALATGGGTATGTNTGDAGAGRSLTLSGGNYDADAELYTQTECKNVDPNSTVTDFLFFRADAAITVTGIDCIVDSAESLTLTLTECDENGGNCGAIEAAITCGTTNTTEAGIIDDAVVGAGHYLRVQMGQKTGTPAQAMICATFTVND